jgi:hypothetical protein
MKQTKDTCSSAERWGECSHPGRYYSWKCAELKATHYTYLLYDAKGNLTCMDTLRPDLPIFIEIDSVCAKEGADWLSAFGVIITLILIMT